MENILRRIRFCADEAGQAADAREKAKTRERLLEDLAETRRRLACNDAWFQLETDDALVEACVYERQSLLAQRRGLLERARRENVRCAPFG